MKSFELSLQARQDLEEIQDFWRELSERHARRLFQKLILRIRHLANHPRTGRDRSDLHSELRSSPVMDYVVYFVPRSRGISVVRVIHGARDVNADDFEN